MPRAWAGSLFFLRSEQPLNAEIEIVALRPGEEEGLTARVAAQEAFARRGHRAEPRC